MSEFCLRMKLNVVGSEKVGKTSLLTRYKRKEFPTSPIPKLFLKDSLYEERYTVSIPREEDEEIEVELWETLVNPYNDRIRPLHYPFTDIFILCFSIDDKESFSDVKDKWLPELKRWTADVPIMLVGTKADLRYDGATKDLVSKDEGEALAEDMKALTYMECSALNCDGVNEVFEEAFPRGTEHFIARRIKYNKKRKKLCNIL